MVGVGIFPTTPYDFPYILDLSTIFLLSWGCFRRSICKAGVTQAPQPTCSPLTRSSSSEIAQIFNSKNPQILYNGTVTPSKNTFSTTLRLII